MYRKAEIHVVQRKVILSLMRHTLSHTLAVVCDRHMGAAEQEDEVMMK